MNRKAITNCDKPEGRKYRFTIYSVHAGKAIARAETDRRFSALFMLVWVTK